MGLAEIQEGSGITIKEVKIVKILALIGSPRKGSNTDILVDQILKGITSKKNSQRYEKLYLYDYEISPCIDCRYCKKKGGLLQVVYMK